MVSSIIEKGGGAVWVKIEVRDKERADRVIIMLSSIKDCIKESRGEGIAG